MGVNGFRNSLQNPPERGGLNPCLRAGPGAWPPACAAGESSKEMQMLGWS